MEDIQNKSLKVRQSIMWGGIFFIMIIIFIIWLLTFPSQMPAKENDATMEKFKNELPGVWQTIKTQINTFENLWK